MSIIEDDSVTFIDKGKQKCSKSKKNGIYEDLKKIEMPEYVRIEANNIYTQNKMTTRKGNKISYIMFVCIYNAYKNLDDPQLPKNIAKLVGLKSSEISRASSLFTVKENKFVSFPDLIPRYCQILGIDPTAAAAIKAFGQKLLLADESLDESFPQNIAVGTIYHYGSVLGYQYDNKKFAETVGLSSVTLLNASKKIKLLHSEHPDI